MLNVISVQYRIGETSQQANSIVYWLIGFYYTDVSFHDKHITTVGVLNKIFTENFVPRNKFFCNQIPVTAHTIL